MSRQTKEGVIQFKLTLRQGPAPAVTELGELNAWRHIFRELGQLGQASARYAGLGFGNLSRRLPQPENHAFLISGTQTGGLATLRPEHYVKVLSCDHHNNTVTATGQIKPSSEALSHGILYQACPAINWVMHLHSPEIFAARERLALTGTDPASRHGTPQMAGDILSLASSLDLTKPQLLIMTGHEDGLLAFGPSAEATGAKVICALAQALATHQ